METLQKLIADNPQSEEVGWLVEVKGMVENGERPTRFTCSFVQLGVCDPEKPYDDLDSEWFKKNQRAFNKAAREIVDSRPGLRQQLRRVLTHDLTIEGKDFGDGIAYGRIVKKSYARELLDHFLGAKPDQKWVS